MGKTIKFYSDSKIDCSKCPVNNFCCTLKVKLSLFDRLRIFLGTGKTAKQYAEKPFNRWETKLVNGDCTFLKRNKDTKSYCTIYKYRPTVCRRFPHFYQEIKDCSDFVKK